MNQLLFSLLRVLRDLGGECWPIPTLQEFFPLQNRRRVVHRVVAL